MLAARGGVLIHPTETVLPLISEPSSNMAEVAGLVIGALGLAALFETCMSDLEGIETSTGHGTAYQTCALKLRLLQLRLARWGQTIEFADSSEAFQRSTPAASEDEIKITRKLLGNIHDDLCAALGSGYADSKGAKNLGVETDTERSLKKLAERVEAQVLKKRKPPSLSSPAPRARWSLRDQRIFEKLIEDLSLAIKDLENLYPSTTIQRKLLAIDDARELVQSEEIEGPTAPRYILQEAQAEVDPTMEEAQRSLAQRSEQAYHVFQNVSLTSKANIHVGDYIANGYQARYGSRYRKTTAEGTARVHYGNNYGGKAVFDD